MWCQDLAASSPLVVASRPPTPCEDYNYKSLVEVAQLRGEVVTRVSYDADRHRETRPCSPYTPNYTPVDGTLWWIGGGGASIGVSTVSVLVVPDRFRSHSPGNVMCG